MLRMEMNVGKLKQELEDLPDDMPVFVACEGYSNYDFGQKKPFDGEDTFAIIYEGKVFITDTYDVDVGDGTTI